MCSCKNRKIGRIKKGSAQSVGMQALFGALGIAAARIVGGVVPSSNSTVTNFVKAGAGVALTMSSKNTSIKAVGVGMAADGVLGFINPFIAKSTSKLLPSSALRGITPGVNFKYDTSPEVNSSTGNSRVSYL